VFNSDIVLAGCKIAKHLIRSSGQ